MRFLLLVAASSLAVFPLAVLADPQPPVKSRAATARVTHVTVYRDTALVTREVDVPEGEGSCELVVAPLPTGIVEGSLYSEGLNGIRVLATRSRTRAVKEDTREEARKLEAQLRELSVAAKKLQGDIKTMEQNLAMLTKLEGFTASTLQHITDKGMLNGDATLALSRYVMETRTEKTREQVSLQQQLTDNKEQAEFVQRQMEELAAGSGKTEHDAVIVIDKPNGAAGKVKLNYLVSAASWRPQYKLRAGKEKEPVQLEYLAAVQQNTGEDWNGVNVTLSTAQPMLNAAPPDLKTLEVSVVPLHPPGQQAANTPGFSYKQVESQSRNLRAQAQQEFNYNKAQVGGKLINEAAALEQWRDLLARRDEEKAFLAEQRAEAGEEGPSVVYHLPNRLTIPSRNDEQVIQVARVDLTPDYFYKAVPVLTPHVYRLANLTNKSESVLLPGEATMYIGNDFVGRTTLPLVAIGEQFTAGFGVDPQVQVQRTLLDKARTMQGGNQVLKYDYRILVSSYKAEPVKLQVWDRLPHAESSTVAVTLGSPKPEISKDPLYQREERPKNLLRWDIVLEPNSTGEKSMAILYDFKLELDRQMQIGTVTSK